jgi:hypothetical protein
LFRFFKRKSNRIEMFESFQLIGLN